MSFGDGGLVFFAVQPGDFEKEAGVIFLNAAAVPVELPRFNANLRIRNPFAFREVNSGPGGFDLLLGGEQFRPVDQCHRFEAIA